MKKTNKLTTIILGIFFSLLLSISLILSSSFNTLAYTHVLLNSISNISDFISENFVIIGIFILVTITILNVLYTTRLEPGEITQITYNGFVYIIGLLLLCGLIFFATNKLDKFLYNKEKAKKILWISAISLYCLFNIIWVLSVRIGNIG